MNKGLGYSEMNIARTANDGRAHGNNPRAIKYVLGHNPSRMKRGIYADAEGYCFKLDGFSAYDRKLHPDWHKVADTWADLYGEDGDAE